MELLQILAGRCIELLDVDAAGLLLADSGGVLRLVAASAEQARILELFQVQNDEDPCLHCYRTGQAVTISDIGAAEAAGWWPHSRPRRWRWTGASPGCTLSRCGCAMRSSGP
jgi:hypothetical protein